VTDPALEAVRVAGCCHRGPVGVFDAEGSCLTANRAFVLRATRHTRAPNPPAGSEGRTPFSPDGVRTWTLVSLPEDGAEPAVADFLDTVANALTGDVSTPRTRSPRYLFMNPTGGDLRVATDAAVGRTADDLLGAEYGAYTRAIGCRGDPQRLRQTVLRGELRPGSMACRATG